MLAGGAARPSPAGGLFAGGVGGSREKPGWSVRSVCLRLHGLPTAGKCDNRAVAWRRGKGELSRRFPSCVYPCARCQRAEKQLGRWLHVTPAPPGRQVRLRPAGPHGFDPGVLPGMVASACRMALSSATAGGHRMHHTSCYPSQSFVTTPVLWYSRQQTSLSPFIPCPLSFPPFHSPFPLSFTVPFHSYLAYRGRGVPAPFALRTSFRPSNHSTLTAPAKRQIATSIVCSEAKWNRSRRTGR